MKRKVLFILIFMLPSLGTMAQGGRSMRYVRATSATEAGGRLWASIDADDSYLALCCYSPESAAWKSPACIVRAEEGLRAAGGELFSAPDGTLMLFYTVSGETSEPRIVLLSCSNPQAPVPVFDCREEVAKGSTAGRPVALDGAIAMPIVRDGKYGVLLWKDKAAREIPSPAFPERVSGNALYPVLFAGAGGSLSMAVTVSGTAKTYVSTLSAKGEWSAPEVFLPHIWSPMDITALPDGRMLMLRNRKIDEYAFLLPQNLYAYYSEDGGNTWYGARRIAEGVVTAPQAVQTSDGKVHVIYTQDERTDGTVHHTVLADTLTDRIILKAGYAKMAAARENMALMKKKTDYSPDTLRICTYNIQKNDATWNARRQSVVRFFREYSPDIAGSQETTKAYADDIVSSMGGLYAWVGSNTKGKTPLNPIFYRTDRLLLEESGIVWFSDIPWKAGYGSNSARLMVWARFTERSSGKQFFCFNSHFDHRATEAMDISAATVLSSIRELSGGLPVVAMGDFNADEDSSCYTVLAESPLVKDALTAVENPLNAQYWSCPGYVTIDKIRQNNRHLDHIFFTPNSSRAFSWEQIMAPYCCEVASDHQPIIITWQIAN